MLKPNYTPMEFKDIQELIKLINKSNLTEFKMEDGDFKLSIRTKKYTKGRSSTVVTSPQQIVPVPTAPMAPVQQSYVSPPPAPAAPAPAATSSATNTDAPTNNDNSGGDEGNYIAIKSPIVGTFYRSSSPDKPPYLKVGDTVEVGSVVCIVEAMKLFNEIESEISGKVVKVMVDDASPVEYDQVLFLVDPKG